MADFRIDASQVRRMLAAPVRMSNLSVVSSTNNTVVTTQVTSVLSTAGDNGQSVPVQAMAYNSTTFVQGVYVISPDNRCEVYDHTTLQKINDLNGNEIYGRLTLSGSVYTFSYYTLVGGVETAYTFSAAASIDVEFNYLFDFNTLPADAMIGIKARNVSDDPSASGTGKPFTEILTIATDNVVPNLTKIPVGSAGAVSFSVGIGPGGLNYRDVAGGAFTVNYSTKAVTYNATLPVLKAGMGVVASYFTFQ